MTYYSLTLPSDPALRAARIAFERGRGGTIYQRPDGSHVLARTTWPPMTPTLPALPDNRTGWTEIT